MLVTRLEIEALYEKVKNNISDWRLDDEIAQAILGYPPCGTAGPPAFTSDLNQTIKLVPTAGFGRPWSWRVGNLVSGEYFAQVGANGKEFYARTPALALCAACLVAHAGTLEPASLFEEDGA
jgi:hypothetical protein